MRVDYLGLEAFVAIADFGSFQRAAEALSLSQGALSHRLRKLENDLAAPLLLRSSREVSLSPLGQRLLPDARRLLKALQDTYASVHAGTRQSAERFSFACLPSIANAVLPEVIAILAEKRPTIAFEVIDIPVARIADTVRSGAAEFGVTIVSAELSDLRIRAIAEEDYFLFLRADHPLAAKGYVTLSDLENLTMARISSQSKNRQLIDTAFGQLRGNIHWRIEVQTAPLAMRLVDRGIATTILPKSSMTMAPASLTALPFKDIRLSRTIGLVSRRNAPLSDIAVETLGHIERAFLHDFGNPPEPSARRAPGPP